MKQKNIRLSVEEILYYLLFSIILFTKGVGLEESTVLFRSCLIVSVLLLACKFIIGKYSIQEILCVGILSIWGMATFLITGSLGMLIYVILIIGMKNVSVKRIFYVGTYIWGICMFCTVTAALFFGRTGVRLVHSKMGLGPLLRESLGYTHPNVLHITYIVFMAFVLYLCEDKGKKRIATIALLILGDIYIFMYSLSYTGLLISIVYFICFSYFRFRRKISKLEKVLIQCILPGCILLSVILPQLLGTGIAYKILNGLLNNRVWAIKVYFADYAMTLFGRSSEGLTFSIDNSYVNALMGYGVIPWCIIMGVYAWIICKCLRENRRKELTVICAFLIAGLSEPFLFNASIKNITVIFIGSFLYDSMKNYRPVICMGSRWNKVFTVSEKVWEKPKNIIAGFQSRRAWITIFLVFMTFFGIMFRNKLTMYEKVYADERFCDCEGETVILSETDESSTSLFIGEKRDDTNYYFFTRENSNLIEIMELRQMCSVSLYIAVTCGLVSGFIKREKK